MVKVPSPDRSSHPVDVGQRTEGAIFGELIKCGYTVLLPSGPNQRYDMVLDTGDSFLRVQCKTARLISGAVVFRVRSTRVNTRGAYWREYVGEIELFAAYCPETDKVYLVPIDEVGRADCRLRVVPPANNQVKRIRWARDYELEAWTDGPRLARSAGVAQLVEQASCKR
jgi:hypothetical protein